MTIAFGCQTHCAQGMDPIVFSQIAAALPNLTYIRDELFYGAVYDHGTSTYALTASFIAYLDQLAATDLGIVIELLWGDPDLDGNGYNMPRTQEQRDRFCDYASFILDEIKGRSIPIFGTHLWNEISGSWPGTAGKNYGALTSEERDETATAYITLATDVFNRLNIDHADVPFGAGADVGIQLDWLQRVIPGGVLDVADALDLHPYGGLENMQTVASLMTAAGHGSLPIWVTEYGATSDTAAIVRRAVDMCSFGATLIMFYLAKPFGSFTVNASLMDATGNITAHGAVFNYMAELLGPSTYSGSIAGAVSGVRAEKFTRAGADDVTVLWSSAGAAVIINGATSLQNIDGTVITPASQYTLSDTPIYAFGDSVTIDAGIGDTLLTSYTDDFTNVQGSPWYYRAIESGVEVDMTFDSVNNRWRDLAQSFWWTRSAQAHPPGGANNFGFAEWFVPADVTRVKVRGFLNKVSGGDGIDFWIEHEGTIRWRRLSFVAQAVAEEIYQVFDVVEGDSIRWRIGPSATNSNTNDATNITGLAIYSTVDAVTPVDLGPVPIPLYVKDESGNILYTLILEVTQLGTTNRKQIGWRQGFFDPNA